MKFRHLVPHLCLRLAPSILLFAAACRTGPVHDPTLEPVPRTEPALCAVTASGVACGGEPCEPVGDGTHVCPGQRDCTTLPSGLGAPTILCQQAPGEGGEGDGGDEGGDDEDGGDDEGSRIREPAVADPDAELGVFDPTCSVAVIAKIRIRRPGTNRVKETHNLAHGFTEVVVPFGYEAIARFRPGPDLTGPYPGTMTASWHFPAPTPPYTGVARRTQADLSRGWRRTNGTQSFNPGPNRPVTQTHSITAEWDPRTGEACAMPQFDFVVTFAGRVATPQPLDLAAFVSAARSGGFGGGTGTRVFHGTPRSRNDAVVLPLGIYWRPDPDCCGMPTPARKVVQFARAAIHGPNGRLAKPWTLDILPSETRRAPNHDPTYTGHPNDDADEVPTPGGAGGTAAEGAGVLQWDAPGMPKDLYDRLYSAQGPSTYRQQFLSLLVCRPAAGIADLHRTAGYLAHGRVRHVVVTTVRWSFPGQADPTPPNGSRDPVISVSHGERDAGCVRLREILDANGLLGPFTNPTREARSLEILPPGRYGRTLRDVELWERNPLGQLRFP